MSKIGHIYIKINKNLTWEIYIDDESNLYIFFPFSIYIEKSLLIIIVTNIKIKPLSQCIQ